jgi:hypothetical protein
MNSATRDVKPTGLMGVTDEDGLHFRMYLYSSQKYEEKLKKRREMSSTYLEEIAY